MLVQLLHQDARLVSVQMRLVADGKLARIQRKVYRTLQTKLYQQWETYEQGDKTAPSHLERVQNWKGLHLSLIHN